MISHLRNLVRINTTNPPGNERKAARYIADVFKNEGISFRVLESAPKRANLVARIPGNGNRRPLLLMGHLDVVGVEEDMWDHPPFDAVLSQGFVWGRGTLDCKNSVALWMMIMILVKRSGAVFDRDLIFLATADEEEGHTFGMEWICKNHYGLIDAEAALNEGGGFALDIFGKPCYTIQNAEKGNIWMQITARGEAGHASVPRKHNPAARITELAAKLARTRFPVKGTETVREMLRILSLSQNRLEGHILRSLTSPLFSNLILSMVVRDEELSSNLNALLRNTICPTAVHGGDKINVIPSEATLKIDCRILPGYDIERMEKVIRGIIGNDFDTETLDARQPSESPFEHELAVSAEKALNTVKPGSVLIPLMSPGVTDACLLRPRGMAVYGFTPLLPCDNINLAHGNNERISVDSIRFSLDVGLRTVLDYIS